ncbi:MAG: AI-2E family transporter [Peptococcaceae bacterium]|nr:AI-2E family transporter [Peptococcaceae bacterium]
MDLNKENMKKIMTLIVFTILVLLGLQNIGLVLGGLFFVLNILFPFILGGALAFVLNLPMQAIERRLFGGEKLRQSKLVRKLARPLSLVLSILLVGGIISIVLLVVVPELAASFAGLGANIEKFLPTAQAWLENLFQNNQQLAAEIRGLELDWDKMLDSAITFFKNGAGNLLNSTFSVAKTIISALVNFGIGFVFACYILLQKETLGRQVKKALYALLKESQVKKILYVSSLSYKTFSSFITGQCLEAVILGTMFFVVMSLMGLPYALLVGVLIAFTALIPIFGAFIGCAISAFLILMDSPTKALIFIILFLVLQQLEGNLIYPHVVGNSIGLPSIWVLAAVTIGGSLLGIVGMLVFIPLTSVIYTLFREYVHTRLKEKKLGRI